jgi:predicted amidophosphoribosyltransferase
MCNSSCYYDSWCNICQRNTIHKNGVCTGCYPQVEFNPQFNYECPECHGKFNTPGYINYGNSVFVWKCPFCGRKLEGL